MSGTTVVDRQVRRVQRRLLWQTLVQSLLRGWAFALLLTAGWFVVRPLAFSSLGEPLRWGVPAALLAVGTLAALVLTWLRAPNRVAAALALDERFALRERVTTLFTLKPEQAATPVAQSLSADVETRVSGLSVGERFPLTLPWRAAMPTALCLVVAGLACFFEPLLANLRFGLPAASAAQTQEAREIQQQLDNLRKASTPTKNPEDPKSDELKELEAEWDKLINRPLDLNDQEKVRERVNDLRKLEDKLKERLESAKEQAEKHDTLRKELEKLTAGEKKMQEGPAKDFNDALSKGDFAKAKDVLEKLRKELKNDKLTKEQQKQLADQFKQIQQKLQRLLDENEQAQQLQKDFEEGKLDAEQLERAMEQFKDMQDLGNVLGDLAQALGRGNGEGIGEALGKAIRCLGDIELSDEELKKLLKCDKDLDEALKLLLKACQNCANCNGMNKGKFPGAQRPIDPNDPETKPKNERQKAEMDPKTQQRITGFVRGGSFSKIPARAVEGAFQQAVQEAPEAIDRQRIPDDAADIARGYFRKLGNQKD